MTAISFGARSRASMLTAAIVVLFGFSAMCVSAQTQPLLPGNLVVTIYGKVNTPTANNTYVDGAPTPISLEQFPLTISAGIDNGTPLLLETLPVSGTGSNVGIVGEYGSSSEGTIQLSTDGLSLAIGGYDGNLQENGGPYSGSDAEAQSTDTNVPRIGALINIATGNVNTSTVLNDVYNTNNPRSFFTANGSTFYLSGQGAGVGDEGGLYLTTVGNNTTTGGPAPTPIFNVVSTRTVTEYNIDASTGTATTTPNLYYSADQNSNKKGTQTGIFEYSGTPTSSQGSNTGTRITPVTGTVSGQTVNFSPQGYFFANATTLYVADTGGPKDGGTPDGGIQKWSYNGVGNVWKLDYTLQYSFSGSSSETGFEALAGQVVNGVVYLYAVSYTANDDDPDGLYGVTDTLSNTSNTPTAGEAIVQLAASTTDMDFKGVAIIPAAATDTPTMPVWGLLILGALLLLAATKLLPVTVKLDK